MLPVSPFGNPRCVLTASDAHPCAPTLLACKCTRSADDTVGDLKKLAAAQTGTRPEKIRIQKWHTIYKDHISLEDCA